MQRKVKEIEERRSRMMERNGERRICRRKERYKTIRFQENANRKISDYKIKETNTQEIDHQMLPSFLCLFQL